VVFGPEWPGPLPSYFRLPTVAGVTDCAHHNAQLFSFEMGGLTNFFWDGEGAWADLEL
jgi:hypothetical protein